MKAPSLPQTLSIRFLSGAESVLSVQLCRRPVLLMESQKSRYQTKCDFGCAGVFVYVSVLVCPANVHLV